MNIYERRFEYAKNRAKQINDILENNPDYIVSVDGEFISRENNPHFVIEDKEINLYIQPNSRYIYFVYDKDVDEGYYTEISELKVMFDRIKFYKEVTG